MRLTLRTLLAYLNEAGLTAKEQKEISARIEQSENAQKLIKHLEVITSDPAVNVFAISDNQGEKNANRVAQYLDSSLSDKDVEVFEKSALESVPLLAEIANSHLILSKVLSNEPIKVPLGIRQKIYSLSPVRGDLESMDEGEFADEHQVRVPTIKPELPTPKDQPAGNGQSKASDGHSSTSGSEADNQNFECGEPNGKEPNGKEGAFKTEAAPTKATLSIRTLIVAALIILAAGTGIGWIIGNGGFTFGRDLGPISDEDKAEIAKNDVSNNRNKDATKADKNDDANKDGSKDKQPTAKKEVKKGDGKTEPGKDKAAASDKDDPQGKKGKSKLDGDKGKSKIADKKNGSDKADNDKKAGDNPKPATKQPVVAATFAKPNQLVVRLDPESNRWQAYRDEADILEELPVITFRGFPTSIRIEKTGSLEVIGKSRFVFEAKKTTSTRVNIVHGLFRLDADESKIEFTVGKRTLLVEVTRPETQVWIRVVPFSPNRMLGDPKDRNTLAQLFVAKGRAKIATEGEMFDLGIADGLDFLNGGPINAGTLKARKPAWISTKTDWVIEASVDELVSKIKRDEPIEPQLTELTDHIRFEFVSVATQMLSSIGYYQPLIQLLDNENNRTVWSSSILDFRENLANSPELVARLHEAFGDVDDDEQKMLFEMLVGTSNEDLEAGADAKLVKQLESKSLARRVLAFENLRQVTGKTFLFRPESAERFRIPKIRRWNRELSNKRIRFAQAEPVSLPRFEFGRKIEPAKLKPEPAGPKKQGNPEAENDKASDAKRKREPDADPKAKSDERAASPKEEKKAEGKQKSEPKKKE